MTTEALPSTLASSPAGSRDDSVARNTRQRASRDEPSFEREVRRAHGEQRAQATRKRPATAAEDRDEPQVSTAPEQPADTREEPASIDAGSDVQSSEFEAETLASTTGEATATADPRTRPLAPHLDRARNALEPTTDLAALPDGELADPRTLDVLRQVQLAFAPTAATNPATTAAGSALSSQGAGARTTPPIASAQLAPLAGERPDASEETIDLALDATDGGALDALQPEALAPQPLEAKATPSPDAQASTSSVASQRTSSAVPGNPPEPPLDPSAQPAAAARLGELAEQRATDILRQVRLSLQPGERQATIQLDPPELGRIAIRLVVRKGRVDTELRVEERATLDVLARHVPELRATFERSGLHSGSFDLHLGFGDQRGETAARNEHGSARGPQLGEQQLSVPRGLRSALASRLDHDSAVDTYA